WAGTLLFLWSPLAVFELSTSAHNEGPLIFFLALSVLFFQRGDTRGAYLSLAASSLVKFVTLPLMLPLVLATLFRRQPERMRRRMIQAAVGLALAGGLV